MSGYPHHPHEKNKFTNNNLFRFYFYQNVLSLKVLGKIEIYEFEKAFLQIEITFYVYFCVQTNGLFKNYVYYTCT